MFSASRRVLAIAMLLCLPAVQGFLGTAIVGMLHHQKPTSSSQLSMAWSLPNQASFRVKPTWYQECGNPCARQVVYDDLLDDDEEFYVSNFRNFGSDLTTHDPDSSVPEQEVLPRGARIGRAARRAFQGLRNTVLRP